MKRYRWEIVQRRIFCGSTVRALTIRCSSAREAEHQRNVLAIPEERSHTKVSRILEKWTGVLYITVRYQRHKTRRYMQSTLAVNTSILQLRQAAFPGPNVFFNMPGTYTMSNTYSMKVHYCGTDVQIFAMQQCLRNENFQAAILEGNFCSNSDDRTVRKHQQQESMQTPSRIPRTFLKK